MNHNKLCNIEDFVNPEIVEIIRDIFAHELPLFPADYPNGVADSKQWEIAMAIRALRAHGALHAKARVLGVGAGTEATTFFLSRHVSQVVASDIYAGAGPWADVAPSGFLVDPGQFAGQIPYDPRRILPLHQDGRALDLPDDEFDGVFSSGSIEHFGSLQAVASAAYEIGRVLKPGGIATIATEFKVAGPPDGDGWDPSVILFSPETLQRWIVDASGLEPVDRLETSLSKATVSVQRNLLDFLNGAKNIANPAEKIGIYPNLILYHEGYLFCSAHLALRKPHAGWGERNAWAAPDGATRASVTQERNAAISALATASSRGLDAFFGIGKSEAEARLESLLDAERRENAGLLHAERQARASLERGYAALDASAAALRNEIAALRASSSWRLTGPLRRGIRLLRGR